MGVSKFFVRESDYLKEPDKCCCFTGHRYIHPQKKEQLTEELLAAIREAVSIGYRHFVTGGALGFDTLAALAVLQIRAEQANAALCPDEEPVTLTLAIPCLGQADTWHENDRLCYRRLLTEANEAVLLFDQRYFNGCMQERNRYMVEHCRRCICFLERSNGGTWQTVRMARQKSREIIMLG